MQDRFKLRMYDKKAKKMYSFENDCLLEATFECLKQQLAFDSKLKIFNPIAYDHIADGRIFMQCTSLKDKNNKLIYEGDIVKLFGNIEGQNINNIHVVKFGDFAMYDFDFQEDFEKGSTAVYGWYLGGLKLPVPLSISLDTSGLQLEVIGNIYENPELLQESEEG